MRASVVAAEEPAAQPGEDTLGLVAAAGKRLHHLPRELVPAGLGLAASNVQDVKPVVGAGIQTHLVSHVTHLLRRIASGANVALPARAHKQLFTLSQLSGAQQ